MVVVALRTRASFLKDPLGWYRLVVVTSVVVAVVVVVVSAIF